MTVMPSANKLACVAKALGVTVEYLLERGRKEVKKKELGRNSKKLLLK